MNEPAGAPSRRLGTPLGAAAREPLLHFVLLGAALFAVYALVRAPAPDVVGRIVITRSQMEQLATGYTRTWQRPPTAPELEALVEDRVREEVLYREAMAMGLDRDDTVVRRRLRQKLEFLLPDSASPPSPPTTQELQAYLERHADRYRLEPALTFEHVVFNRERRGQAAAADALALLARLNGPRGTAVDLETAGDPSMLPSELARASVTDVERIFGGAFARALAEVGPGRWAGPLESSYGMHLVFVRERSSGGIPDLDAVRDRVMNELLADRHQEALDAAYRKLRQRYTVIVEPLAVAEVDPARSAHPPSK